MNQKDNYRIAFYVLLLVVMLSLAYFYHISVISKIKTNDEYYLNGCIQELNQSRINLNEIQIKYDNLSKTYHVTNENLLATSQDISDYDDLYSLKLDQLENCTTVLKNTVQNLFLCDQAFLKCNGKPFEDYKIPSK